MLNGGGDQGTQERVMAVTSHLELKQVQDLPAACIAALRPSVPLRDLEQILTGPATAKLLVHTMPPPRTMPMLQ